MSIADESRREGGSGHTRSKSLHATETLQVIMSYIMMMIYDHDDDDHDDYDNQDHDDQEYDDDDDNDHDVEDDYDADDDHDDDDE